VFRPLNCEEIGMTKFFRVTTLVALALSATALTAQAQGTKQFGVLAGVGFANMSGDDVDDADPGSRTGFVGGLYFAFPVANSIAIEPEVLYAMKGSKFGVVDIDFNNDYIEVPVLVKYTFNPDGGPYLLAGPAVGFSMSCNESDGSDEISCEDAGLKTLTTFGGVLGIGFQKKRFGLEARYDFDFNDALELDDGTSLDVKNAVWEILARIAIK